MPIFPLFGPKFSAFLIFMSLCGVVFLSLLGVFFMSNAVTLFPDIHYEGGEGDGPLDEKEVDARYYEKAIQCWTAAGMYGVTFIFVLFQNRYNVGGLI
uniref:Aa_trans domain-containing protein n=1 Tax=Parastrongyloides trichosuri TaxID=131310 RepID=A0A0N5A2G0_PARTI